MSMSFDELPDFYRESIQHVEAGLSGRLASIVYCSWGKDSSAVVAVTLAAMKRMKARGEMVPRLYVCHSDTLIENPMVANHAKLEAKNLKAFADKEGLPVSYVEASPNQNDDYINRLLSGRGTASVIGMSRTCQQDLKKKPLDRAATGIRADIAYRNSLTVSDVKCEHVLELFGMRFDESAVRAAKMRERNNSATTPQRNEESGAYQLCPIALWDIDSVKFFMLLVRMKDIATFSDFESLWEIYQDASGECHIITSDRLEDGGSQKGGCASGLRTGCWLCLQVSTDKSFENMLLDPAKAHMKPLNDIRNWLGAEHWNPSNRNWTARSQLNGWMTISPSGYSPAFVLEFFRYLVTADRDELLRATENNEEPRFEVMTLDRLYAIESMWSRYGLHKPFTALFEFDQIMSGKASYYPPAEPKQQKRASYYPELKIKLNERAANYIDAGFTDLLADSITGVEAEDDDKVDYDQLLAYLHGKPSNYIPVHQRKAKTKKQYMAARTEKATGFSKEGLELHFQFELKDAIKTHLKHSGSSQVGVGVSIKHFIRFGILALKSGAQSSLDRILRLAAIKEDMGLTGAVISDPVAIVHLLNDKGFIDTDDAMTLNETMLSPQFQQFYRAHYGKTATAIETKHGTMTLQDAIDDDFAALFAPLSAA